MMCHILVIYKSHGDQSRKDFNDCISLEKVLIPGMPFTIPEHHLWSCPCETLLALLPFWMAAVLKPQLFACTDYFLYYALTKFLIVLTRMRTVNCELLNILWKCVCQYQHFWESKCVFCTCCTCILKTANYLRATPTSNATCTGSPHSKVHYKR